MSRGHAYKQKILKLENLLSYRRTHNIPVGCTVLEGGVHNVPILKRDPEKAFGKITISKNIRNS
jgi:hypothetical protein